MTMNEQIGSRIRKARETRGYTAAELATMMEKKEMVHPVSANIVYRWESGKQPIPADSLVALLQCLECSPYYILGDSSPVDEEDKKLHNAIQHLPRRAKRILTWLITEWIGCFLCLLETGFLYSLMQKNVRKTAIRHCLKMYKNELEHEPAPFPVDVCMIKKGVRRLNKDS